MLEIPPVIRIFQWLACCCCFWALAAPVLAQDLGHAERKPPAFTIVDDSGFFSKSSGALERISDQLRKLEAEHGFKIYLVVESVLITGSAQERATELFQQWLPEGNGLVVVFESDSRRLGVGRDLSGRPDIQDDIVRVPSHETNAILTMALQTVDPALAREPYLEAFAGKLVEGFEDYFKRLDAPPPPERSLRIGLLVVGTLALLGLGGIIIGAFIRHSGMATTRRFYFPVVDRPERLGAPCGGSVTARRFKGRTN